MSLGQQAETDSTSSPQSSWSRASRPSPSRQFSVVQSQFGPASPVTLGTKLRPLPVVRHATYPPRRAPRCSDPPGLTMMHNISRTTARVAVLAGCALVALGCQVPTDLPVWNTVWQVPADSSEVTVASLLPSSVAIVDVDASTKAFSFSLPEATTSTTLGET